jgi:hypothetical protein
MVHMNKYSLSSHLKINNGGAYKKIECRLGSFKICIHGPFEL